MTFEIEERRKITTDKKEDQRKILEALEVVKLHLEEEKQQKSFFLAGKTRKVKKIFKTIKKKIFRKQKEITQNSRC